MTAEFGQFKRLMDAMMEGSKEAVWELVDIYTPYILRTVRASLPAELRPKLDSTDCAQSVWKSLLLEPELYSNFNSPHQFIAYIASVAKYKVIDKQKYYSSLKNDVRREVDLSEAEFGQHNDLIPRENVESPLAKADQTPSEIALVREAWERALERTSSRDQEIISLRIKGQEYKAIADRLSIDERTAQRSIHRFLKELQQ